MRTPIFVLACVAFGCGSHNTLTAYEGLATDVRSQARAYGDAMAEMPAKCVALQDNYDATVRPMIEQMSAMAGEVDGMMTMHDGPDDMTCMTNAMAAELDRHRSVACVGNLTQNQTEAAHHASLMVAYGSQTVARCHEIARGASGMWSFSPTISVCGH